MTRRPAGRRPPDGHPDLNVWLTHVASHHESAHAVAAYIHRYPCLYVELQPITDGRVGEKAHFVQDLEAVNIALNSLNQRGLPCNKAVVLQCAVLEIGRAVNVVLNGVELDQAVRNAQCDIEHRDEIFDLNGLSVHQRRSINQASQAECERLIRNEHFCLAVYAVADLLTHRQVLSDYEVALAVEHATPLRCRSPEDEPAPSDVRAEAFFLHTRRGGGFGAIDDWLSAERGLRFFRYASA